jgi:hypothetical protein
MRRVSILQSVDMHFIEFNDVSTHGIFINVRPDLFYMNIPLILINSN